jgi:hypothetical protein
VPMVGDCRQKAEQCMSLAAGLADFQPTKFYMDTAFLWTEIATRLQREQAADDLVRSTGWLSSTRRVPSPRCQSYLEGGGDGEEAGLPVTPMPPTNRWSRS